MKALTGILATWLLACLPLYAAEQDSADAEEQQADGTPESSTQNGAVQPLPDIGLIEEAREQEQAAEEDQDFVPSIRITEDLPVAFPADI